MREKLFSEYASFREAMLAKMGSKTWTELKKRFEFMKIVDDAHTSDTTKPMSLQIGYFPGVSEKDLRIYATSLAQSSHVSEDLTYIGIYKFLDGYAYEVHEGGPCKALLPEIFSYYEEKGEKATPDTPTQVYLNTVTRTLLVEIHPGGLTSYMLPENQHKPQTEAIKGSKHLERISFNNINKVYEASKLVVSTGLFFLLVAILFKPALPAIGKMEASKRFSDLPVAQWKKASGAMTSDTKTTITFAGGAWTVKSKATSATKVAENKEDTPQAKEKEKGAKND